MKINQVDIKYQWLFGLVFLAPIAYSTRLQEMDTLQKLSLYLFSVPAFLVLSQKNNDTVIKGDKILLALLFIFPVTFLTSLFNKSSELLPLQFVNFLTPVFIILLVLFAINKIGEYIFLRITSYGVVITATLFSIIGLLQVMGLEIIPLPQILIPGSTIGQRGFAAEYLLPAIPYLFILNNYLKEEFKPLLFISGVINLTFLFYTRSRASIIIVLIILLVIIVYILKQKSIKNKFKIIVPILSIFIISFLMSFLPPASGERSNFGSNIKSVIDANDKSKEMRVSFWDASFRMIIEKPFSGSGLQKWSGIYPKYKGDDFTDSQIYFVHGVHAHNDYLELSAENGIFSGLTYLLIHLLSVLLLIKKIKRSDNYLYILLSMLSSIAFSFLAFPFSKFSSYFLLVFAIGLAINEPANRENLFAISVKKLRTLLIIVFIFGALTAYKRLNSELEYINALEHSNSQDFDGMIKRLQDIDLVLFPYDAAKQPVEYYFATALYRLGNLNSALEHSLISEQFAPNNPLVLHNTAAIYQSLHRYNKAIFYYEKLRTIFPNYLDPQINLAICYFESNMIDKGKALFDELSKKYPSNQRLNTFKNKYYN